MELSISKDHLTEALHVTQSVVEKKTTMPILSNLLLSARDGKFTVSSTDLEITAVTTVSADVSSPGSTTVNARVLGEIVRELPEGDVRIKLAEGERLEIECESSKLRMIGVSAEEYPSLPGMGLEAKARVSSQEFLDMVSKTLYAVSVDETRFNLNGVCFELSKEGKSSALQLVATDGHRLCLIKRPVEGLSFDGSVIVPRKGLSELKKILSAEDSTEVGVDIQEGFFLIDTGNTKISMRLIDGEFPDYQQVLPKDRGVRATIANEEIIHALKRVALMVTDKGKCVKLDFSQGRLKVSSSSPELGDASEELDIDYAGEPLSIGFNARYIIEFCQSLKEIQRVNIDLHGELGPGKLTAESDESYVGIVMPMRLS